MMYNHYFWGGFGLGWIFVVLFWVFIIWLIVALVRVFAGHGEHHHWHSHDYKPEKHEEMREMAETKKEEDAAMKILKERYAKGEIGKGEFEEKKKDIMG